MKMLTIALALSNAVASGYVQNALSLTTQDGTQIISNRDVECVALAKDAATFTLNPYATRYFFEHTSKNIGKTLNINVCGGPAQSPVIAGPLSNGKILGSSLSETQVKCLKDSFQISDSCKECPVCKN